MSKSSDYSSFGANPTVSKERWLKHAIAKLSKGYMLIVSKERHVANFYKGYEQYESCSYHAAHRLIRDGYVEEAGRHESGLMYALKEEHRIAFKQQKAPEPMEVVSVADDDDDDESGDVYAVEENLGEEVEEMDDSLEDDIAFEV